jgi:hypothetical protein
MFFELFPFIYKHMINLPTTNHYNLSKLNVKPLNQHHSLRPNQQKKPNRFHSQQLPSLLTPLTHRKGVGCQGFPLCERRLYLHQGHVKTRPFTNIPQSFQHDHHRHCPLITQKTVQNHIKTNQKATTPPTSHNLPQTITIKKVPQLPLHLTNHPRKTIQVEQGKYRILQLQVRYSAFIRRLRVGYAFCLLRSRLHQD